MNPPYTFQIGQFVCTAISDGGLNYPIETFFRGTVAEDAKRILLEKGLPTTHIYTPYTLLYVETPSRKILIDTGMGRVGETVDKIFQHIDNSNTHPGRFLQDFHHRADVDIVIITHAHADHIGGTVDAAGELHFPNASYVVPQVEWDFWFSDERTANIRPVQNVAIARDNLRAIRERVTLVAMDAEIVDGIVLVPASGHTPGHVAVQIESDGQQLIHISDAALHPLHLEYPHLGVVFDNDPRQADETKRYILDMAAARKLLVFAHHFPPFPNLGHVEKTGDNWLWRPLNISPSATD